jgi:subtilisin family serine protease/subtilisin-like proprotein convertase family protein
MKHLGASSLVGLASVMALAGALSPGRVWAQGASGGDSYFVANGQSYAVRPSADWVGVKVKPNTSGALLRGLAGNAALDGGRKALRAPSKNIVLLPLNTGASAAQKRALVARLGKSTAVARTHRLYSFGSGDERPLIDSGDVIVRFTSGDGKKAAKALSNVGATIVRKFGSFSPNTFLVRVPTGASGVAVANALQARSDVVFSHPDFLVPLKKHATTNDPLFRDQWHLSNTGQRGGVPGADARVLQAWDITRGSASIKIAIVDDGIDIDHEDLKDRLVPGVDVLDGDADPRPTLEDDDHGTACAGVAVASGDNGIGVSGAAPGARLMPIRMLDGGGFTPLSAQAEAFNFATRNGADVISNSWGPGPSGFPVPNLVKAAIDNATSVGRGGRGCVVLFASGNQQFGRNQNNADLNMYAANEKVISVGGSTNVDLHAAYSNRGETLDIVAPTGGFGGSFDGATLDISTTDRTGKVGYDKGGTLADGYASGNYCNGGGTSGFSGTSSATPLVAGIVGLLLSAEPNLTFSQVRERLIETADKIDQSGGAYDSRGHSVKYGFGRVNALRVLQGRVPKVTLIAPAEGASLSGKVTVRARTSNDERVSRMVFEDRQVYISSQRDELGQAIPDFDPAGIRNTVEVPGTFRQLPTTANVRARIEHEYVGDLLVALVHRNAQGQEVREVIYDHEAGGAKVLDLDVPLPLRERPITGTTYSLLVIDDAQEDRGTLVSWGLSVGSPFAPIGTQQAAAHQKGTDWTAVWDTSTRVSGTYEVRATAVLPDGFSASDTNGNLKVAGRAELKYALGGRVVDAANKPLANILVTNATTGATTRTNVDGRFTFADLPAGSYLIAVSDTGSVFTPGEQRISLTANRDNILFTRSTLDRVLPTITVAAPLPSNSTAGPTLRSLASVTGTASDGTGSGIARVVGTLQRLPQSGSTLPSGFYTKVGTFVATASADTERPAILKTTVGSTTVGYTFAVPSIEGSYRLTLKAFDRAGNSKAITTAFVVDRTLPVITVTNPKPAAVLKPGVLEIKGTVADLSELTGVTVQLLRRAKGTIPAGYFNGTTFVPQPVEVPTIGRAAFTLRTPSLSANSYRLAVTATDKAGNKSIKVVEFTVAAESSVRTS